MSTTKNSETSIEVIRTTIFAVLERRKRYVARFLLNDYEITDLEKDFKITRDGENFIFKKK